MAYCGECSGWFQAVETWQVVCKPCYKGRKQEETRLLVEQRDHYRQRAADRDYWRWRTASLSAAASPLLSPDMLKRLLQLCHPHRHGNSKASNEVPRFLLALRK